LNDIHPFGCHSSIFQLYLSIQYVCIMVQIMYSIHFEAHVNVIQDKIYFICDINYFDLLLGAHPMKMHSQQQFPYKHIMFSSTPSFGLQFGHLDQIET